MPLAGTAETLAAAIATAVSSNSENTEAVKTDWKKVAEAIISHVITNAVVVGSADGKPLEMGRIT